MNVAIRTDASSRIGSGHVMRCKALADELRRRGADVRFVCRADSGHLIPLLTAAGYAVTELPAPAPLDQIDDATATMAALSGDMPDWLVVDHYQLDEHWESRVRPHARRLCVIDDLANRSHACDVLLDQNWVPDQPQRYAGLVPAQCRQLLGPRYALLPAVFADVRSSLPERDGLIHRVLVFFGAVDSFDQTTVALHALADPAFADLSVDVVVGGANAQGAAIERLAAARPSVTLHRGLSNLAALMTRADVMFGAGGTTTWERCTLGLPAVVAITADNQERSTLALAASGAQRLLGRAGGLTAGDWAVALARWRAAPEEVRRCSAAARAITDGRGAARVVLVLQQQRVVPRLRQAAPADEPLVPRDLPGQIVFIGEGPLGLPIGQVALAPSCEPVLVAIDAEGPDHESAAALLRSVLALTVPQYPLRFIRSADAGPAVHPLRVTMLSDRASWLNPALELLVYDWFREGLSVRWIHDPRDLVSGDVCFLLGCSTVLPTAALALHRHTLVVHESDLPRGRGWSPLTWQVLEGADRIVVTLFEASARVDAGPIHLQTSIALDGTELVDDLRARQAEATVALCRDWVRRYPAVLQETRAQAGPGTTYRRRTPLDSELDPDQSISDQFARLRVADPERYPTFFTLRGQRYVLSITKGRPAV